MSGARQPGAKPLYRPPVDDDAPPDLVEQAIIRALVPILVERIRARVTQEQPEADAAIDARDRRGT